MSSPPGTPLILIVDDNEKNLKLHRDVLRAGGFRTIEAATAGEGIALATEFAAGRDPDGHRAAGHGREGRSAGARGGRAHGPDSRRRAERARRSRTGGDWLLAAGFAGYLEKPISVAEFPDQVRRYCRRD